MVSKRSDIPLERTDDSDQSLWMYSRKDKSLREFGVHLKIPTGAVFSPDGHRVAYPDGRELFYNPRPNGFESVPVITKPVFSFGNPIHVPRPFQLVPPSGRRLYDVLPDGRFLGLIRDDYGTPPQINIVTHWFAELRALASATR